MFLILNRGSRKRKVLFSKLPGLYPLPLYSGRATKNEHFFAASLGNYWYNDVKVESEDEYVLPVLQHCTALKSQYPNLPLFIIGQTFLLVYGPEVSLSLLFAL